MASLPVTKLLIGFALISGIIIVLRSYHFIQVGRLLITSTNFPRQYAVGTGRKPLNYLVLGDSTAIGVGASKHETSYPYQFASKLAELRDATVKVTNIAVSGARLKDVRNNQLPKLRELKADIVSISIGGNDATHLTSTKHYTDNFRQLISELQSLGIKEAYITNTPDMQRIPALPTIGWIVSGWRSKVQNRLTEQLLEHSPYNKVDIYNDAKLQAIPDYAADRFHPNDQGYERWARAFIAALD